MTDTDQLLIELIRARYAPLSELLEGNEIE